MTKEERQTTRVYRGGAMKYQVGRMGRVIVGRFENREDIINNIAEIARKEDVRSGVFNLIGGIRTGRIVVGPEDENMPPRPVWREIGESAELVGFGTIFWQNGEPKIHLHGSFGKRDWVRVGCLRGSSETFLILEVIIFEIEGIEARREFDQASGLTLLKV